jgi:hypothetical protein
MNKKIERLFRVPYKRLESIKKDIRIKKFAGMLHRFPKDDLLHRVEQADAAAESAIATFEVEIQHHGIAPDLLAEFREAHQRYYAKSRQVRDWIIDRESTVFDFLVPVALAHSV